MKIRHILAVLYLDRHSRWSGPVSLNPSSQLKVAFPPILLVVRTMVPLALGSISSHRVSTQVGAAGSQEYLDPQVSRSDPGILMEGDVKMRGAS